MKISKLLPKLLIGLVIIAVVIPVTIKHLKLNGVINDETQAVTLPIDNRNLLSLLITPALILILPKGSVCFALVPSLGIAEKMKQTFSLSTW